MVVGRWRARELGLRGLRPSSLMNPRYERLVDELRMLALAAVEGQLAS